MSPPEKLKHVDLIATYFDWIPDLPKFEIVICFVVWIFHALYAWVLVYDASNNFKAKLYHGYFEPGWSYYGQVLRRDVTIVDFDLWTRQLMHIWPFLVLHSVMFNYLEGPLGKLWKPLMVALWWTTVILEFGIVALVTSVLSGLIIYLFSHTGRKSTIYISGGVLVFLSSNLLYFFDTEQHDSDYRYYLLQIFLSYKILHFTSFALCHVDLAIGQRKCLSSEFGDMIFYCYYSPYSRNIVVLYGDFQKQFLNRCNVNRNWKYVVVKAFKLLLYCSTIETISQLFHANALIYHSEILENVSLPVLYAIGYVAGQTFHLKYSVYFGLPSLMVSLDRMVPVDPPICISRVAMYSKMWRNFDRGLYRYIVEIIYKPIQQVTSDAWRYTGHFTVFVFVLVWHGFSYDRMLWLSLNLVELIIEITFKRIFRISAIADRIRPYIGCRSLRRILMLLQCPLIGLGTVSTFVFLSDFGSGIIFVRRFYFETLLVPLSNAMYVWIIGYCFCNVCLQIEKWEYVSKIKVN